MTRPPRFEVSQLTAVIGKPVTSDAVIDLFGADLERVVRDDCFGHLSYERDGLEVGFREAWFLFKSEAFADCHDLYLSAVHLHSDGYGAYCEYRGAFPGDVRFGDTAEAVIHKLGMPTDRGGGDRLPPLGIAPQWIRYTRIDHTIHFQFGRDGGVELVTLGRVRSP